MESPHRSYGILDFNNLLGNIFLKKGIYFLLNKILSYHWDLLNT